MNSTTRELLDELRAQLGSDTKAGAALDVSQVTVSRWRSGRDFPTDENAVRLAALLQLDPGYVLAIVRRDRAKNESTRAAWQRIAERFKDAAVVAAMAIGAASFGAFNNNSFASTSGAAIGDGLNTHCRTKRRRILGVQQ